MIYPRYPTTAEIEYEIYCKAKKVDGWRSIQTNVKRPTLFMRFRSWREKKFPHEPAWLYYGKAPLESWVHEDRVTLLFKRFMGMNI